MKLMINVGYSFKEILKTLNSKTTHHSNSGYYRINTFDNTEKYLIMMNIGKDAIKKSSISDTYFNKFFNDDKKTILWYGKKKDRINKKKRLWDILKNLDKTYIFYNSIGNIKNNKKKWYYWGHANDYEGKGVFENMEKIMLIKKKETLKNQEHSRLENICFNINHSELIGYVGEKYFFDNIKIKINEYSKKFNIKINKNQIKWLREINQKASHDFFINNKIFIEIKTTTEKKQRFILSSQEFELLKKFRNKYFLIHFFNVKYNKAEKKINSCKEKIYSANEILKLNLIERISYEYKS